MYRSRQLYNKKTPKAANIVKNNGEPTLLAAPEYSETGFSSSGTDEEDVCTTGFEDSGTGTGVMMDASEAGVAELDSSSYGTTTITVEVIVVDDWVIIVVWVVGVERTADDSADVSGETGEPGEPGETGEPGEPDDFGEVGSSEEVGATGTTGVVEAEDDSADDSAVDSTEEAADVVEGTETGDDSIGVASEVVVSSGEHDVTVSVTLETIVVS